MDEADGRMDSVSPTSALPRILDCAAALAGVALLSPLGLLIGAVAAAILGTIMEVYDLAV